MPSKNTRRKKTRKNTRKKKGGRLGRLGKKITEILKRITALEDEDEIQADDIMVNKVDIGIIRSYINYKLSEHDSDDDTTLKEWQHHLNGMIHRHSTGDGDARSVEILRDANILSDDNIIGGGITRKKKGGHHLYKRLGVNKNSSQKTIKKSYNKLKKSKKLTKKTRYAYKILSKNKTRKQYNNKYKKRKKKKGE